jgi:hypothetical protein
MRVFLGLTEVSGHYRSLERGFAELGVRAFFLDLYGHPFQYAGNTASLPVRWFRVVRRRRISGDPLSRLALSALEVLFRLAFFLWAIVSFDAFIFGFGTSFLWLYDLPLLKLLGKKVVFQFHGSDSRPTFMDGALLPPGDEPDLAALARGLRRKKQVIRWIDRFADVVVDNPTTAHFHERPVVNWLRVGLASAAEYALPAEIDEADRRVALLHCPSSPRAKGSQHIEDLVGRLQNKGLPVRLVQVTGQPNAVVLRELSRCDIAIDQTYSDYASPGFATEASWFGKPVVIGGYAVGVWTAALPAKLRPPTLYCHPDELERELERLVRDAELWARVGRKARAFVRRRWSARAVAGRYLRLLRGTAPPEWLFDPREIRYLHGCCAPEAWVRKVGQKLIGAAGVSALQFGDKPELEAAFLAFCGAVESPTLAA